MKGWHRPLSRRRLLALGGTALAGGLLGEALAQAGAAPVIRVGAVLPTRTGQTPVRAAQHQAAGEAARMGALMAEEEFGFNAELLGRRLEVRVATAPDADAAVRAAERLIAAEEVFAFMGGFGEEAARALGGVAEARRTPFFNIGSSSDALRHGACSRYTFHVEASAAMYLDALSDWYVRSAFRRWFFVYAAEPESEARYARVRRSLSERHFGAREVGSAAVDPDGGDFSGTFAAIEEAQPEVVLLLFDAVSQLEFVGQYEGAGLSAEVAGFPEAVAQTRTFYAASRNAARRSGSGYRAALWEARLDAYGARELNERFVGRWGTPLDGPGWAAYESVKMLFESASFAGSLEADKVLGYLEAPSTTFDVHKGIGVSFRPWDHQLRQPLYLVKIDPDAENAGGLASLVGELPALYLPGTDPLERLDQLGDLAGASSCRL